MVERLKQVDDELFAVLSNGEILVARIDEWKWKRVFDSIHTVHALTATN
ncbi:MAG: hypothetical protein IT331_08135 [Anaerolineae bacterium]|nr:hypothetical protein [Anaerolineae bacterium]